MTSTYSTPLYPIKGQDVTLNLQGTFTDDASLAGLKVYVEWNKTPLYVNDFPRDQEYSAGDPYQDTIVWFVPGFAPSGHYAVQVTLHDKSEKVINFGCITADFDL